MIKNGLKKIIDLTSIFLSDSYQNIDIINNKTHKLNKKSIFVWMIAILLLSLLFISDKIIKFLVSRGQPEIFLNVYFLILAVLILFQTILVCTNVFYFSKDLEFILPLPLRPIEILISKYATVISKLYISEMIFALIPILIYGIRTDSSILYYIYALLVLVLFPIFLSLVVSMVMMFVMKISKFIKNKDLFQLVMTLLLMIILLAIEYRVMGNIISDSSQVEIVDQNQFLEKVMDFNSRIRESNKYFLVINPSVDILINSNITSITLILKLIVIDSITFILFVFIGKCTYLKDILKNTTYLINKRNKQANLQKKCKKRNVRKTYILKEFKGLFRNPMFFMQCVYPVITWLITIVIVSVILIPKIELALTNEEVRNSLGDISFDISIVYVILGLMQLLFMISPASLIAVSREGKNAIFMKYIPLSLYKQFTYKGLPQIFINTISILVILGIVRYAISSISWNYILAMFILSVLLNIINSYMMLLVDFIRPKLNWDTEYDVLKQNNNKIFQYVFAVLIILILVYLAKVFENINLNTAIVVTGIIFGVIIILINIFALKKQNKIYEKIM